MSWNNTRLTIPLDHLDPFEFSVDLGKKFGTVTISVSYSHHCFTDEKLKNSNQIYDGHQEDPRYFCFQRYGKTFDLNRIIIDTIQNDHKIFLSNDNVKNVMFIKVDNIYYQHCIYFELIRKSKKKISMYVRSSYGRYNGDKYAQITNTMHPHKALEKIKMKQELPRDHKKIILQKDIH